MKTLDNKQNLLPNPLWFIPAVIIYSIIILCILFALNKPAESKSFTASWYSVSSCLREGTTGIMANGKKLDDSALTAASWNYPFGTLLTVQNLNNNKCVVVEVTDRGPNKSLYRKGRIIDLSKAAFSSVANLDDGIIPVAITVVMIGG